MFSILQKLVEKGVQAGKKFENRDMMQAVIAGSILVAYADGDCKDEEIESLAKIIAANPSLSMFGGEIDKTIDSYVNQMKASKTLGRVRLMREIEDVKASNTESEEVFAVMVTIAEADGNIDASERKVLGDVAKKLNLKPSDFGL